jgi:CRISPR/Cas system type I-B associated protein Csh2 (Cas7 group RAMP superfamily)
MALRSKGYMTEKRKNIFMNDAMSDQLKGLRDRIHKESGLRVSEQDLIRSAIDVYIQACACCVDLNTIATVGAVDRTILELLRKGNSSDA